MRPAARVIQSAVAQLEALLEEPRRDRMRCLLLYGPDDMDKTGIIDRFMAGSAAMHHGAGISQSVVRMCMPAVPTERSFYNHLLRALGGPAYTDRPFARVRAGCRTLLQAAPTRMLIVEDLHLLREALPRRRRLLLNTLRFLANDAPMSLVGVGTDDARIALLEDEQLADRLEALDLSGASQSAR